AKEKGRDVVMGCKGKGNDYKTHCDKGIGAYSSGFVGGAHFDEDRPLKVGSFLAKDPSSFCKKKRPVQVKTTAKQNRPLLGLV
ncbi:unnamed protein product, partial [Ilex paraguariensis]